MFMNKFVQLSIAFDKFTVYIYPTFEHLLFIQINIGPILKSIYGQSHLIC